MKHSTPLKWFEHHSRRHATFVIAVGLIGVLFVAAIIGILSGRYKPFADVDNVADQKLNRPVTLPGGDVTYTLPDGSTKTNTGTTDSVTVGAITNAGAQLQAANPATRSNLSGNLTVYRDGESPQTSSVRNIVVNINGVKSGSVLLLEVDSDTYRDALDAFAPKTSFTVVYKPDFYLAVKKSGVTNPRDLGDLPAAPAGDLNNDNRVDISDFAILGPKFNQSIAPTDKLDINGDGVINLSDFAIIGPNFGKSGEAL